MGKLKSILKNLIEKVKNLAKDIPVTMITIFLATLFFAVTVDTKFETEIIEKVMIFAGVFGLQSFFVETWVKNKFGRLGGYICATIIALIFTFLIFLNTGFRVFDEGYKGTNGGYITNEQYRNNEITIEITVRVLIGYLISVFALTVYKLYKKSELNLEHYIIEVFKNAINTVVLFGITNTGVTLVILLFMYLILGDMKYQLIMRMEIILFGLVLIPLIISGISEKYKEKNISKFIKVLTLYIMFTLVCIATVIIYMYIGKILVTGEMPSNEIFRILAILFVLSFPIWVMAFNYIEENKIVNKLSKILPIAFIPFIFLQIYSMGLRSGTYGLTPLRYLSYMLIVFEVFAIMLSIYKKREKLKNIFFVFVVLALISTISPWNCIDLSNVNQKDRLFKYLEIAKTGNINNEDKAKMIGAYNYLKYKETGKKYIDNLTKEDIELIDEYKKDVNNNRYNYNDTLYFDFRVTLNEIDVSDYNYVIHVSASEYSKPDLKKIILYSGSYGAGNRVETINIEEWTSKLLYQCFIDKEIGREYFTNNNLININENKDLLIENINIRCKDKDSEKLDNVENIRIEGYLLRK